MYLPSPKSSFEDNKHSVVKKIKSVVCVTSSPIILQGYCSSIEAISSIY
jgi:hypothetical protein